MCHHIRPVSVSSSHVCVVKKEAKYEVGRYFSIIFLPEVLLGGGGICNATKFEVKTAFCKP